MHLRSKTKKLCLNSTDVSIGYMKQFTKKLQLWNFFKNNLGVILQYQLQLDLG